MEISMNRYSRTLALALTSVATLALARDPQPLPDLVLDARQQAAMGVRLAPVEAATTLGLVASAQVGLPPGREVVVAAPYAGTLTRVDVGVGDSVAAGAVLARMSSTALSEARRQWREAQLDVEQWQLTLRREQALLDEGLIPQARFDLTANRTRNAEAALAARAAELQAMGTSPTPLKEAADFTSAALRAPQAGHVIESGVTVGQRVEAGAPMFRLADTRQLQLDLQLSVDKARQVRNGDAVTIPHRQASAVIVGVSRSTDASQIVRARARVTQPGHLSVGEVVPAYIQSPLPTTKGWRVPIQAVVQHPTTPLVFVATDKGFRPTPVRVLSSDDDRAVVDGALQAQSRVAVTGVASLRALQQQEP
jgi:cobalt-zinc-cadmium efflux system membrane fusion protein